MKAGCLCRGKMIRVLTNKSYIHLKNLQMHEMCIRDSNEYGAWVDVDSGVYEGVISGEEVPTIAVNIVKDQYYVVEIFFTWEHLGTTEEAAKDANCLMYYIEHRDMGVDIHADANILAPAMYNRLVYLGNRKEMCIRDRYNR